MKVLKIIIFIYLAFVEARAQSYLTFDEPDQNIVLSSLALNDSYVLWVNNECDSLCHSIYKIRLDQSIIYKKEIYGSTGKLYKSKKPEVEFLICGFRFNDDKYELVLKQIDFDGNIFKTLIFNDPLAGIHGYQVIDDGAGYIFNTTKRPDNISIDTIYLFKSDYDGNILWQNKFIFEDSASYVSNGLMFMTQFTNTEFACVGKYTYKVNQTFLLNEKSFLIRFDNEGKISFSGYFPEIRKYLWEVKANPYTVTGMQHFICAGNHDSYVVTAAIDTVITIPDKDWASRHALLLEFDSSNKLIDSTIISNYISAILPTGITMCRNGDILFLDYGSDPVFFQNYDPGFRITRVNPQGEVIWQRTYVSPIDSSPDSLSVGPFRFSDMAELVNGSIIVVGAYYDYEAQIHDFEEDAIVIILDSMGCFNPNKCEMYTNVFQLSTTVSVQDMNGIQDVSIYPIPANNVLNIQINNKIYRDVTLEIYNLLGNKVLSKSQYYTIEPKALDISKLNEGIYSIKIYDKNRLISAEKFIKFNSK